VFSSAIELGTRTGTGERLGGLTLGPAFVYGAGVSVAPIEPLWFSVEVDGELRPNRGQPGAAPTELLGSVRGRVSGDLLVTAMVGGAVTSGVGAPAWRLGVGLGWAPGWSVKTMRAPEVADEAVAPSGLLLVEVKGPAGEKVSGALIRVEGQELEGASDLDGRWEHRLPPGEHFLQVTFPGRMPSFLTVVVPDGGTYHLRVALEPEHQDVAGSPVE
jgi:hypothetical protein